MISRLEITDRLDLPIPWWKDVEWFRQRAVFEFTPRLNIIFGPNASGKSTLIRLLAQIMHCYQGGYSRITEESIRQMSRLHGKTRYAGFSLAHDGQPVYLLDPSKTPGLVGGEFDNDFYSEGVDSVITARKLSAGVNALYRIQQLKQNLARINTIECTMNRQLVNEVWESLIDAATYAIMNPTLEKSVKTILMDEPDRSFDVVHQAMLWKAIPDIAGRYQVIVATHSCFALNQDANYISSQEGYVQEYLEIMKAKFGG